MPRSTREWALRKLLEAHGNLDWAIAHIGEVVERYEEPHPEIAEPMMLAVESLMQIESFLIEIRKSF